MSSPTDRTKKYISQIVAREYFAKPMHALFKFLELAAYDVTNVDISHPALDLGCGIGSFGSILCQFKGCGGFAIGSDLRIDNVRHSSRRRGTYRTVLQSDARALPIRTGTLKFVLCSCVLHGISPGYDLALSEIGRVLAPGGTLAMTVATPQFTTALLPTRWLNHLGLRELAGLYCRKVNDRNGHKTLADVSKWQQELERAGLEVEKLTHYFSGNEAAWWSVLAMRPFQLCAIFRYFPRYVQRIAVSMIRKLLQQVPSSVRLQGELSGFLLIIAKKKIVRASDSLLKSTYK